MSAALMPATVTKAARQPEAAMIRLASTAPMAPPMP